MQKTAIGLALLTAAGMSTAQEMDRSAGQLVAKS